MELIKTTNYTVSIGDDANGKPLLDGWQPVKVGNTVLIIETTTGSTLAKIKLFSS